MTDSNALDPMLGPDDELDESFFPQTGAQPVGWGAADPQGAVVGPQPLNRGYAEPNEAVHNPLHPEFYDPYYDSDEWTQLHRRSPLWMRAGLILGAIALIGLVGFRTGKGWWDNRVDPPGPPGESIEVAIPAGATSDDIARILAEDEVVASSLVTSYYWRFNDAPEFQAGTYIFRDNMSVPEAQEVLEGGPLPPVFNGEQILIPEGLWLSDVRARMLDELPDFNVLELASAMTNGEVRSKYQPEGSNDLEGLLFPAVYDIPEEELDDERALVQKMVNQFDIRADVVGLRNAPELVGITPYEAVIVASLIEEEAKFDIERPMIARVIYNRLADGQLLQIDATVIRAMGFYPEDGVVLNSDLEIDSPFNTYKYPGLPPTPISSPGQASLEAALNPAEGEWRYYVVIDEEGNHAFAETFAQHEANIAQAAANGVR